MALTEWERENARREAVDREKDNAKQLRRQTEIMQRTEAAQWAAQQHAAEMREAEFEAQLESVRAAQQAERHAEKAEKLAQKQLKEQRAHNFAMWRQTTANGAAYEEWANRAVPLIEELNSRDARWSSARAADIEAYSAAVTAEVLGRHGLDSPRYEKVNQKERDTVAGLIVMAVIMSVMVAAPLCGVWAFLSWVASIFGAHWPWQVYVGIVVVVSGIVWPFALRSYHVNIEWHAHGKDSLEEIEREKSSFEASIPANWHDATGDPARALLERAASTIEWMPRGYTEFQPSVLTEIRPVPSPVDRDGIDERATGVHALLREWDGAAAARLQ